MEDMEEYARCLDVIGQCNHIIALDEISDSNDSPLMVQDDSEPKNTEAAPRILIDVDTPTDL